MRTYTHNLQMLRLLPASRPLPKSCQLLLLLLVITLRKAGKSPIRFNVHEGRAEGGHLLFRIALPTHADNCTCLHAYMAG